MGASRVFRRFRDLVDVTWGSPSDGDVPTYDALSGKLVMDAPTGGGGGGAPTDATYITQTANGTLSAEQAMGSLATGIVKNTTTTGVQSIAAEGTDYYAPGGTDVAVVDGGTGASTAAGARTNLGLGTAATHPASDFDSVGAAAAAQAASQPVDSDLSAIAALTTTSFGRGVLEVADAAALRTAAGLGSAATHPSTDFDSAGAAAAAQAASQPLDSDLTAVAAVSTTSYGRALLATADAAALRTAAGSVIGTDVEAHDADLTTIAGLSPTNDDLLQRKAGAWANRTIAQLLTDLAAAGTTFQPLDSDLTAIAALTTTSFGRSLLAVANAAAARTTIGALQGSVGTSMPGSPATNDVVFRTDLGLLFYYDGSQWLTVTQYRAPIVNVQGNSTTVTPYITVPQGVSIYVEKMIGQAFVLTTNSGSAYWSFSLNKSTAANSATLVGSFDTTADTHDVWTAHSTTINSAIDQATYKALSVTVGKTGAAGNLYASADVIYRIIGT